MDTLLQGGIQKEVLFPRARTEWDIYLKHGISFSKQDYGKRILTSYIKIKKKQTLKYIFISFKNISSLHSPGK